MNSLVFITAFTVWPTFIWLALIMTNHAVRGSRKRYVYRTLLRPLQWIALSNWVLEVVIHSEAHSYFWVGLNILNALWTAVEIRKFYASDEDDWWSKTGKRIKRWAKRTARSLVPKVQVPVRVTAR